MKIMDIIMIICLFKDGATNQWKHNGFYYPWWLTARGGLVQIPFVLGGANGVRLTRILHSNQAKKQQISFMFGFCSDIFWPNLAPRPAPTGQARQMVQNAHDISPGNQL